MPEIYNIEITPAAERDVEKIWTYIAADRPENATDFISQLGEQVEKLEKFPERCPLIPENEQSARRIVTCCTGPTGPYPVSPGELFTSYA